MRQSYRAGEKADRGFCPLRVINRTLGSEIRFQLPAKSGDPRSGGSYFGRQSARMQQRDTRSGGRASICFTRPQTLARRANHFRFTESTCQAPEPKIILFTRISFFGYIEFIPSHSEGRSR